MHTLIKLYMGRVDIRKWADLVLYSGPSWCWVGRVGVGWAELVWSELVMGRVVVQPIKALFLSVLIKCAGHEYIML